MSSNFDDVPWNGKVNVKPSPASEANEGGFVFHDVSWQQPILSLATLLPLNLIARNQEKLQVARALNIATWFMHIGKILSIQVDGIYCQPPKGVREAFCKEVREATYKTVHNSLRVNLHKYVRKTWFQIN